MAIEELAKLIPTNIHGCSGKVFYSGRLAFSQPSTLYMLGLNPGGCPVESMKETVAAHTNEVLSIHLPDWSAYRDESWEGRHPGTFGMAPRILHLFRRIGLNPGHVPASNLVFVRSRREAQLFSEIRALAELCWPFHARAIQLIRPKVILCLGKTAGWHVRNKLGAHTLKGEFVESNKRCWRSEFFSTSDGPNVVVATHPSIANWCAASADPSNLVESALA
jgi:uracil-DNA glycosylase family 4